MAVKLVFLTQCRERTQCKESQIQRHISALQGAPVTLPFTVSLSKEVGEHLFSQLTPKLVFSQSASNRY